MTIRTVLSMILSSAMSSAVLAGQTVPLPKPPVMPPPAARLPAPSIPSVPSPMPIPAVPAPAKDAPKPGRKGGTPGYSKDGQAAAKPKPGKPGGTPGLLAGDWTVDVDATMSQGGAGGRAPSATALAIKVDAESITFTRETQNGDVAQRYLLDGSPTSLTSPGRGASSVTSEAKIAIDGEKLLVKTTTGVTTSVVTWFIENDRLIQERQVGERTVRTVYKKKGS